MRSYIINTSEGRLGLGWPRHHDLHASTARTRALEQLHTVSTRKVQHDLDRDLVELEVEVGSARPKSRLLKKAKCGSPSATLGGSDPGLV